MERTMNIDSYSFGKMVIEGKSFNSINTKRKTIAACRQSRAPVLRLHRVTHRLGEQHALFGPQFKLLGRVHLIAIVEPSH
jgi:hypothetical protein